MPFALIGVVFQWVRGSALGRYTALALGLLIALVTMRAVWRRGGARDARRSMRDAANSAATQRRETRDEIDRETRRAGAADRLRSDWSRD